MGSCINKIIQVRVDAHQLVVQMSKFFVLYPDGLLRSSVFADIPRGTCHQYDLAGIVKNWSKNVFKVTHFPAWTSKYRLVCYRLLRPYHLGNLGLESCSQLKRIGQIVKILPNNLIQANSQKFQKGIVAVGKPTAGIKGIHHVLDCG